MGDVTRFPRRVRVPADPDCDACLGTGYDKEVDIPFDSDECHCVWVEVIPRERVREALKFSYDRWPGYNSRVLWDIAEALGISLEGDGGAEGEPCEDCGDQPATPGVCPYGSEMRGDESLVWLCDRCAGLRAEDI